MITTVATHEIDRHQKKNAKKYKKNFVVSFFYCIFVLRKENNNKKYKTMKAIKLYKIQWDLKGLTEEERKKVLETLPQAKGFTTQDDNFNVAERVPKILKKKYGYDIINFAFAELRVVDTVEDLLLLCAPTNEKVKKLFKNNGSLSTYGETCFDNLETNIRDRIQMESQGKEDWEMPTILDEVMIGIENVTGMTWEGHTVNELMTPVVKKINDKKAANLKSKFEMVEEGIEDYEED